MSNHHQTSVGPVMLGLGVCGLFLATAGPGGKEPIPDDLTIVARYHAGYSSWKSWQYTITRDGKVAQEILGDTDSGKESTLTEDDLRDLLAKIEEADFFALKKNYASSVTDNPTLVLKITRSRKTHEVSVYAPRHLEKEPDVKRFFKIWAEVLKKVPAPNPDQKPELYKP